VTLAPPQVLGDDGAIVAFEAEWRAFTAAHASSPFDSPDWLRPWWRAYAGDARPRLLVWRDEDGGMAGVAPLHARRTGSLARLTELGLWGGHGPALRGLADVVATADQRSSVVESLGAWLADGPQPWDLLSLLRLPADSAVPGALDTLASSRGWRSVSLTGIVRSTTYVIDLPPDEGGWKEFIGAKARHNMRTESNRFTKAGGTFEQRTDAPVAAEAVGAIRGLMTARWGDGELDFGPDPAFEPFLVEAFTAMLGNGSLYVDLARDAKGIRACLATMVLNRRAVALVMGVSYEDDVRKMSLGKQLFDRSIGEAVRRGCETYDFLWAGGYKESFWHAQPRTLESRTYGRGLRGGLVSEQVRLRRRVLPSLLGRRTGAGGSAGAGSGA
jgi:CelD/BcsL family acetyltransferase involved in cellulose biosynthesis